MTGSGLRLEPFTAGYRLRPAIAVTGSKRVWLDPAYAYSHLQPVTMTTAGYNRHRVSESGTEPQKSREDTTQ